MSTFESDDDEGVDLVTMINKLLRHKNPPLSTANSPHQRKEPAEQTTLKAGAERRTVVHHQPLVNKEERLVYDALVKASDPADFLSWVEITHAAPEEVLVSFDDFLLHYNRAAWEAMSYIIGPHDEPKSIVERYIVLDRWMMDLARLLPDEDTPRAMLSSSPSHTLWRIWIYCMISIYALVDGKCIVDQTIWLRGTNKSPPSWVNVRKEDMEWKLKPEHGIFAQSISGQDEMRRGQDVQMMVILWHRLSERWCQATVGKGYRPEATEYTLIYLLSRPTGPADLIKMLSRNNPSLHRLSFRQATRIATAGGVL